MTSTPLPPFLEDVVAGKPHVTVIGCGAIAREILAIVSANGLDHIDLRCLPAILHNNPQAIAPAVDAAIDAARQEGATDVFVAYADCGTGGMLDAVCRRQGVARIEGPHCYAFFTGNRRFEAESDAHLTTFWLTDFLARQFDAFVTRPLKLDRHPELIEMFFGRYERVVFLAQTEDTDLDDCAAAIAAKLRLAYERRFVGYGDLTPAILAAAG